MRRESSSDIGGKVADAQAPRARRRLFKRVTQQASWELGDSTPTSVGLTIAGNEPTFGANEGTLMNHFRLGICAASIAASIFATPAAAATVVTEFVIAGEWFQVQGAGGPFGLSSQPALTIAATLDNTKTDGSAFLDLTFVTGLRTWTLADIDVNQTAVVWTSAGNLDNFSLRFTDPLNRVNTSNSVSLSDGVNRIACNSCVSLPVSAVPEPTSWALMIAGFGMAGSAVRLRRRGRTAAGAVA